jgi:hypothetical protein
VLNVPRRIESCVVPQRRMGIRPGVTEAAPPAWRQFASALFAMWPGFEAAAIAQGSFLEQAQQRGVNYYVSQGMFSGGGQFGCGVALVDLDNDGDDDIVCLGAQNERLGFFRNDGTGHFSDVSLATGVGTVQTPSGIAAGDYDGDGDLDLAITRWIRSTVLLRNEGNFVFTNVSSTSGITGAGAGAGCAWADYNGDGWIDLAVANRTGSLSNMTRNRLWRNNGNGTFSEVATALGIDNGGWPAFTVTWCDLDLDGDQDLYVGNDKGTTSPFENRLYRNNGDGTFFEDNDCRADVRADAMGTSHGDLDHDGRPELYVSSGPSGNFFLTSIDGGISFIDATEQAGVGANTQSWGSIFFDPDSDGRQDLYVLSQTHPNQLLRQIDGWPLFEVGELFGVADPGVSYCVAVGDIDRDGDPDLLLQNHLDTIRLYVNHIAPSPTRRWIEFMAKGRGGNTFGIGTRVVVSAGGRRYWSEVAAGTAYKSQSTYRQRVGLGNVTLVDEVEVTFPKAGDLVAATRRLRNVPTNLEWPLWPPEALGDADGDGVRTMKDRAALEQLVGLPCLPERARFDMDGDSSLTMVDVKEFDAVQCDLDGDGAVSARDLAIALSVWGGPRGDFDASGATDAPDIALLLAAWTE